MILIFFHNYFVTIIKGNKVPYITGTKDVHIFEMFQGGDMIEWWVGGTDPWGWLVHPPEEDRRLVDKKKVSIVLLYHQNVTTL